MGLVVSCKGFDGKAHLVNAQVSMMIISCNVDGIEAVVEHFNCHSQDRSEFVKSLNSSDAVGSGAG